MSLLDIIPGQRRELSFPQRRARGARTVSNHGLSAFAREQGVTIPHAYRVVMGDRTSKRLLAAWVEFKAKREQQPAA